MVLISWNCTLDDSKEFRVWSKNIGLEQRLFFREMVSGNGSSFFWALGPSRFAWFALNKWKLESKIDVNPRWQSSSKTMSLVIFNWVAPFELHNLIYGPTTKIRMSIWGETRKIFRKGDISNWNSPDEISWRNNCDIYLCIYINIYIYVYIYIFRYIEFLCKMDQNCSISNLVMCCYPTNLLGIELCFGFHETIDFCRFNSYFGWLNC